MVAPSLPAIAETVSAATAAIPAGRTQEGPNLWAATAGPGILFLARPDIIFSLSARGLTSLKEQVFRPTTVLTPIAWTEVVTPAVNVPRRAQEIAWRQANTQLLRDRYADRWVALEGDAIIADGGSAAEVVSAARRKGIQLPYIFRVTEERNGDVGFFGV
jgi:hypothetical protein